MFYEGTLHPKISFSAIWNFVKPAEVLHKNLGARLFFSICGNLNFRERACWASLWGMTDIVRKCEKYRKHKTEWFGFSFSTVTLKHLWTLRLPFRVVELLVFTKSCSCPNQKQNYMKQILFFDFSTFLVEKQWWRGEMSLPRRVMVRGWSPAPVPCSALRYHTSNSKILKYYYL